MSIPDGAQTVTVEGRDLKLAIAGAATELGIHPAQVDYKLDLSHFRSKGGVSVSRHTVKINAWGSDRPEPKEGDAEAAAAEAAQVRGEDGTKAPGERKPRKERAPREDREERSSRDRGDRGERKSRERGGDRGGDREERRSRSRGRDRGDRGDRDDRGGRSRGRDRGGRDAKPERLRGPEEGSTDASKFAGEWFETLLGYMSVEGSVSATGNDERVHLAVTADRAGRIIGKRGSTLGAIRHLLGLTLEEKFGELTVDVDIEDNRPADERRTRDRSDRGDRGGRGRGRDRGDRRESQPKSKFPEEKLQALARRAAEKAVEKGQTITINLELNSYDRRLVHLEISEIDGVDSRSEERVADDGTVSKVVQVIPADA